MGSELVAMGAPGGGPVTVGEWLEHVQQGYSRFAPAFEAVGIDFLDNLAERDEDVRGLPPAEGPCRAYPPCTLRSSSNACVSDAECMAI